MSIHIYTLLPPMYCVQLYLHYFSPATRHLLPVTHCLLPTECCPLPAKRRLLSITRCPSPVIRCPLSTECRWLPIAPRPPPLVRHPLSVAGRGGGGGGGGRGGERGGGRREPRQQQARQLRDRTRVRGLIPPACCYPADCAAGQNPIFMLLPRPHLKWAKDGGGGCVAVRAARFSVSAGLPARSHPSVPGETLWHPLTSRLAQPTG